MLSYRHLKFIHYVGGVVFVSDYFYWEKKSVTNQFHHSFTTFGFQSFYFLSNAQYFSKITNKFQSEIKPSRFHQCATAHPNHVQHAFKIYKPQSRKIKTKAKKVGETTGKAHSRTRLPVSGALSSTDDAGESFFSPTTTGIGSFIIIIREGGLLTLWLPRDVLIIEMMAARNSSDSFPICEQEDSPLFPGTFPVYFFRVINLPPSGLKLYNFGRYFRQQTVNIPHSVLQLFCYLFCVRKENPKITDKRRIFLPRGILAVSIHHTGENLCRSAPRGISINVRNRD